MNTLSILATPSPIQATPGSPVQHHVNAPATQTGRRIDVLFDEPKVLIKRDSEIWKDPAGKFHSASITSIKTTDEADFIRILPGPNNTLTAQINGKSYDLPPGARGELQTINIETHGGDDYLFIDPSVSAAVQIMAGAGNDYIDAGAGYARISGGSGNDTIRLGGGGGIAQGDEGDDVMIAGTGDAVLSGGKGNDLIYTGTGAASRVVYLNGDQGDDHLYAGEGHNVLNGGRGSDTLVGGRDTTFYSGQGHDTIYSRDAKDRIFAKASDVVHNHDNANVTLVDVTEAGQKGIKVEGSAAFVEAAEDLLDQLRGSPVGQQTLKKMDSFVDGTRGPVTLRASEDPEISYYHFRSTVTDRMGYDELLKLQDKPALGYIRNGVAGAVATHGEIELQTFHFAKQFSSTPLLNLQHELAHAFNGATGTYQPGNQQAIGSNGQPIERYGRPVFVENVEYQAVGLDVVDGAPFDYDNDPATKRTTTNPSPFSENALRKEMGVPLRDRYLWDEAPHPV